MKYRTLSGRLPARELAQVVFFGVFLALAHAQTPIFTPGPLVQVGDKFGSPTSVAVADLNGDSVPDLVLAADDGVHVLTGLGTGRYELSRLILPGQYIRLAVADLNRDGHADVAATSSEGVTAVLLGDGKGSFRKSADLAGSVVIAIDLDEDGIPDLPLLQKSGVTLFFGLGDGNFRQGATFSAGNRTTSIAAADFNRDGKTDLAMSNYYSRDVSVLLAMGKGEFRSPTTVPVGDYARDLVAADFNRDGKPDLAIAGDTQAMVWLGMGDGGFTQRWVARDEYESLCVATGDFNRDGNPDIVFGHYYGGVLSILLGTGDGSMQAGPTVLVPSDMYDVIAGDQNGDGIADLIVAGYSGSGVFVTPGNGTGGFGSVTCFGHDQQPQLRTGDLNGDGAQEIVIALPLRKTVVLLDPSLERRHLLFFDDYPFDLAIVDVDRDRTSDLVVATADRYYGFRGDTAGLSMLFIAGRKDGTLSPPISTPLGRAPTRDYGVPVLLAAGDFAGAGSPTILVANNLAGTLELFRTVGNGTFERIAGAESKPATQLVVADFNGDRAQDVAVLIDGSVNVYAGSAAGLARTQSLKVCDSMLSGTTADFNTDSKPDLAAGCSEGKIVVLQNSGSGLFQISSSVAPNLKLAYVVAGDFDGDGNQDIVGMSRESVSLGFAQLLTGRGDGLFQESGVFTVNGFIAGLPKVSNGNARPDLIMVSNTGRTDHSARNQIAVSFLSNTIASSPPGPLALVGAASFRGASIAPNAMMAAFGENLSVASAVAQSSELPTELAGTSVVLTDQNGTTWPASLYFVSPAQINFLTPYVPWGFVAPWGPTVVSVIRDGRIVAETITTSKPVVPGLFTANADGRGVPAAYATRVGADGTQTTAPVSTCGAAAGSCVPAPIDLGGASDKVYLSLYGAGFNWCTAASTRVEIAGVIAPVDSLGAHAQYPGLYQVNVLLPPELAGKGEVGLKLTACQEEANPVTVSIR